MKNKYFRLYSTSKLVKGKDKGAAYILDENRIEIIPLSLIEIVELLEKYSIDECRKFINSQHILNEYIEFLVSKRIGCVTEYPDTINSVDEYYNTPSHIFLSCIEINEKSTFDLKNFVKELNELLCKHVELRILHDDISLDELNLILGCFEGTTIRSITLYIKSFSKASLNILLDIVKKYKKVSYTILFSMDEDKMGQDVIYTTKNYNDIANAPFNSNVLFVNLRYFTEAKRYNPFYYKKISINKKGEIKNNLICKESFGKYCPSKNPLQRIINNKSFTKYWEVGVDKIEDIKDSELRYAIFPSYEIIELEGKYYFKKN